MSIERIVTAAVGAVLLGGLAAGFALIGPPGHARLVQLDDRRVEDLATIADRLHRHVASGRVPAPLPSSLGSLRIARFDGSNPRRDPQTGVPYAYARESAHRYRLCATFALAVRPTGDELAASGDRRWPHPAGRACYRFDVTGDGEPVEIPAGVDQRY